MSVNRPKWKVKLRKSNYSQHTSRELVPQLKLNGHYSLDEVLQSIVKEGGCALDYDNLKHAAGLIMRKIEECLVAGISVSLPIGRLTPGVTGLWEASRRYDSNVRAQNEAVVRYAMTAHMRRAMANPLLEEIGQGGGRQLAIYNLVWGFDGSDMLVTQPGAGMTITGDLLLMNGDLPERGVYLLEEATGAVAAHIRPEEMLVNTRKRIVLTLPRDLAAGTYLVRVVSQCTTSPRPLKEARGYTFPRALTVE